MKEKEAVPETDEEEAHLAAESGLKYEARCVDHGEECQRKVVGTPAKCHVDR